MDRRWDWLSQKRNREKIRLFALAKLVTSVVRDKSYSAFSVNFLDVDLNNRRNVYLRKSIDLFFWIFTVSEPLQGIVSFLGENKETERK